MGTEFGGVSSVSGLVGVWWRFSVPWTESRGGGPTSGVPVPAHVASLPGSSFWLAPCPCGHVFPPLWIPASASTRNS